MQNSPFNLAGKTALITGGNGGIGLGMAKALAQHGCDIVIWGTNAAKNAAAQAELSALGRKVSTQVVDVSDEAAVDQGMERTLAEVGKLDAVIANAGVQMDFKPFTNMSMDDYRKVMGVNIDGVILTMRAACRHMVARAEAGDPGGALIAVSSLGATKGAAGAEHYIASKGAVLSMMRAVAVEHAKYGVSANTILPGFVATDMSKDFQTNPAFQAVIDNRVPMKRWGEPSDIGGIAVYLVSDCSRYHTGDYFLIDGGFSCF